MSRGPIGNRVCIRCGRVVAQRRGKYCVDCYKEEIQGTGKVCLPEDHPFTIERRARIERMRKRARKKLPLFEKVNVDLS
jgi:hypothetical protein